MCHICLPGRFKPSKVESKGNEASSWPSTGVKSTGGLYTDAAVPVSATERCAELNKHT